ncbi:MAG: alpha/beta hydrolase [Candidatus Dormibacteraeota bacterium]|nr:alpha/beta hydrolase [Candidatus Dormibacteraeota bacterium]
MAEVREQHEAVELRVPGLLLTEHEFSLPLDHARPAGDHLTVFAREVADPGGLERPYLVFFQGGPGHEAPRAARFPSSPGWLDRALQDYRVLMLDQRGTGRSSPIGSLPGLSADQQADRLTHFRADSIVRDAELIRRHLGVERWSVLGQSFGGFCVTSYLSLAPDGLREAFITGGLPPLHRPVDDVYSATYRRVLERNRRYHVRYPYDIARLRQLRRRLEEAEVRLPGGDRLTWRRFRQLGSALGMSDGAAKLHHLLELPTDSPAFLHDVEAGSPFARNPLYAIVHEASYADGCVTGWSAERLLPAEFDSSELLTGEHVYPWMFEDYSALRPLAAAAERLAQREWPRLYDEEQLGRNQVPAAAAVYSEDMYVERQFSEETARAMPNLRVWLTSEYDHNGLRADGGRILDRLIHLARNPA